MKNLILTLALAAAFIPSLQAQTLCASTPALTIETENGTTLLTWETQREVNSRSFTIERSEDGNTYAAIGVAQASGGSLFPRSYSYTDFDDAVAAYYRIQLVMMDGQKVTSAPVQIKQSKPEKQVQVEKVLAGK